MIVTKKCVNILMPSTPKKIVVSETFFVLERNDNIGAVVEAGDPPGMVPTSTSRMYKEFDNIHMLWMAYGSITMPLTSHLLAQI
jgi:hypothetical protein